MSKEKIERNKKIAWLYLSSKGKHSFNSLARDYKISVTRVKQIVDRYKKRHNIK